MDSIINNYSFTSVMMNEEEISRYALRAVVRATTHDANIFRNMLGLSEAKCEQEEQ